MNVPLLEVENLHRQFVARRSALGRPTAVVTAVEAVSFALQAGTTLALVGESGCGKTTLGRLVLRLVDATAGRIRFDGRDVTVVKERHLKALRRNAQLIFQDPYASVKPKLIVCDEPVSALDVSIRAQVLNLLRDLQRQLGLAYIFISHDLAVVKHVADRIAVMHLGRIVEIGPSETLFANPRHPYTRALLSAIPVPAPGLTRERIILHGEMPSALHPPAGCAFHTRCPVAIEQCRTVRPELVGNEHATACHRSDELPPANVGLGQWHRSPSLERLVNAFRRTG